MRRLSISSGAAMTALILLSSCSEVQENREPIDSYLYEEPYPELAQEIFDHWASGKGDYLKIGRDGRLEMLQEGVRDPLPMPIVVHVMPERRRQLAKTEQKYISDIMFVSVDGRMEFSAVLDALNKVEKIGPYILVSGEMDIASNRLEANASATLIAKRFAGEVEEQQMAIMVGHSSSIDQCEIVYDDRAISPSDLNSKAYDKLKVFVDQNGGAEAINANKSLLESLIVVIQADSNTPWRCVGRTMFWTKSAGWPAYRFESM